jgi:flavodoxin I
VDASSYDYEASLALKGDKFCGLAIDNINEEDKTEERIEKWITQLKAEI